MAESKIIPNWYIMVFHFWEIYRGKGVELVKLGIVLPLLLIFKLIYPLRKINLEKLPVGGGARG